MTAQSTTLKMLLVPEARPPAEDRTPVPVRRYRLARLVMEAPPAGEKRSPTRRRS